MESNVIKDNAWSHFYVVNMQEGEDKVTAGVMFDSFESPLAVGPLSHCDLVIGHSSTDDPT